MGQFGPENQIISVKGALTMRKILYMFLILLISITIPSVESAEMEIIESPYNNIRGVNYHFAYNTIETNPPAGWKGVTGPDVAWDKYEASLTEGTTGYEVMRQLERFKKAGINTVRVWLPFRPSREGFDSYSYVGNEEDFNGKFKHFLESCTDAGIWAIPVIFDSYTLSPSPNNILEAINNWEGSTEQKFIQDLIKAENNVIYSKGKSPIIMWDLFNEPWVGPGQAGYIGAAKMNQFINMALKEIKDYSEGSATTIVGSASCTFIGKDVIQNPNLNVVSSHPYGVTINMLDAAFKESRKYTNKPFVATEMGGPGIGQPYTDAMSFAAKKNVGFVLYHGMIGSRNYLHKDSSGMFYPDGKIRDPLPLIQIRKMSIEDGVKASNLWSEAEINNAVATSGGLYPPQLPIPTGKGGLEWLKTVVFDREPSYNTDEYNWLKITLDYFAIEVMGLAAISTDPYKHLAKERLIFNDYYTQGKKWDILSLSEKRTLLNNWREATKPFLDNQEPNPKISIEEFPKNLSKINNLTLNASVKNNDGAYSFYDVDESLILWLRMENAQGKILFDDSPFKHNSEIVGEYVLEEGQYGDAVKLLGNGDYIKLPTEINEILNDRKEFTISLWANFQKLDNEHNILFGAFKNKGFFTKISRLELINYKGAEIHLYSHNGIVPFDYRDIILGDYPEKNSWYHITFVYGDGYIKSYLNGVESDISKEIIPDFSMNLNDEITIGAEIDIPDINTSSAIFDEILIFSRALSSEEAASLYNSDTQLFVRFKNIDLGNHDFTFYTVDKSGEMEKTESYNVVGDYGGVIYKNVVYKYEDFNNNLWFSAETVPGIYNKKNPYHNSQLKFKAEYSLNGGEWTEIDSQYIPDFDPSEWSGLFGDSLTYNAEGSWVNPFEYLTGSRFFKNNLQLGVPGFKCSEVLEVLKSKYKQNTQMFIQCGSNDMWSISPGGSVQHIKDEYMKIFDFARKNKIKIYLMNMPPIFTDVLCNEFKNINEWLFDYYKNNNSDGLILGFADVNSALKNSNDCKINMSLTFDGIHPFDEGSKVYAKTVFEEAFHGKVFNNHFASTKLIYDGVYDLRWNMTTPRGEESFYTINSAVIIDNGNIQLKGNKFDGNTTDFSKITNFNQIEDLFLEAGDYGSINFSISGKISFDTSKDLDIGVEIRKNFISLDSGKIYELNKPAIISFYDAGFLSDKPIILRDGASCNNCFWISYKKEGNKTIHTYKVPGFSAYTLKEGHYCGDLKCNNNESCSSCSHDCGICQPETNTSCGNTICDEGETCSNCPVDCGICNPGPSLNSCTENNKTYQSGVKISCGTDVGECKAGQKQCTNGKWGDCIGSMGPAVEICDGKDNDCDGKNDEDFSCICGTTKPCGSNIGACKSGNQTCSRGQWGACEGGVTPVKEICNNGLDDDCDGLTDLDDPDCDIAVQDSCTNGIQDNGEDGIDCGGPCEKSCEIKSTEEKLFISIIMILSGFCIVVAFSLFKYLNLFGLKKRI